MKPVMGPSGGFDRMEGKAGGRTMATVTVTVTAKEKEKEEEKEERRICSIISDTEREGVRLALERPLRVTDLLRLERILGHLSDSREILCPTLKPEEVLPEPERSRFCDMLAKNIDSAVRAAERVGALERPEEFSSMVFWSDRLRKTYKCP
jgi:hypothetical protein